MKGMWSWLCWLYLGWLYFVSFLRGCPDQKKKGAKDLNNNTQKKWVDEKTGYKCFMLYARSLDITWGDRGYWKWKRLEETGDENIELAKLSHVCWLDVRGKLNMSELSPDVVYEIVYEVKLTNGASGWELPITLKLSLPNGTVKEHQVSLLEKPRKEWIELNVGDFKAMDGESGEVCFDFYEHGRHWKNGLRVKGAILRPKKMIP